MDGLKNLASINVMKNICKGAIESKIVQLQIEKIEKTAGNELLEKSLELLAKANSRVKTSVN